MKSALPFSKATGSERGGKVEMDSDSILALIGPATLLPIPRGQKRPILAGWQNFGAAQMRDPAYLADLNSGGNIGVLLGEIKLSDRGIGFLTIDEYNHFRIPQMYATLILIFILAVGANVLIGRLETRERARRAK